MNGPQPAGPGTSAGDGLLILSPKRNKRLQTGWEGFFPYYAGYPEMFAREILTSAGLARRAKVLDPWNGSGTSTYAASELGFNALGLDLNPVMIIVARARLLPPSEADHLRPLAASLIRNLRAHPPTIAEDDPLLIWFDPAPAAAIRGLEHGLRRSLVGARARSADGVQLDRISGTAATLYSALFAACRRLAAPLRSSNPTWLKTPKTADARVCVTAVEVTTAFAANVRGMAAALAAKQDADDLAASNHAGVSEILLSDTTTMALGPSSVDFVLTSPPYCTRIDYAAATRIELAVLAPLLVTTPRALGGRMIGTTQSPQGALSLDPLWGGRCSTFLDALRRHPSKASAGYYYRTHLDYFDKMARSMSRLAPALKPGGRAVFVVQDSYYKDLHNDLPTFLSDCAEGLGLELVERRDFRLRSMSDVNPGRKTYARPSGATEAVLHFRKPEVDSHP